MLHMERTLIGPRMLAQIEAMEAEGVLAGDGTGLRYQNPQGEADVGLACFNMGIASGPVIRSLEAAGWTYRGSKTRVLS